PTLKNVKASSTSCLPVLATMPRKLEKIAKERSDNDKPTLFSLIPTSNMHCRHLNINVKTLASNKTEKGLHSYANSLCIFHNVLDFTKLGYNR
ncbi:MAG: hypothetical protein EXX96DRAFT_478841, partial [Benjaminiella poitrasii]